MTENGKHRRSSRDGGSEKFAGGVGIMKDELWGLSTASQTMAGPGGRSTKFYHGLHGWFSGRSTAHHLRTRG